MRIDRLELLGVLRMLEPAISSSRNQVPELAHVWFTGTEVSAFNDVLGIRVALATDFTGGVRGDKLIGVLERSTAREADVEVDADDMVLKIGAARIKLTRRPIEDWFWQPEVLDGNGYIATRSFRDAVASLLLSVGADNIVNPEQRGVTIIQNGAAADLYSTDAVSLSWVRVNTDGGAIAAAGSRIILPTPFCEQLKALKGEVELRFDDNAVYCITTVRAADGEPRSALIFSRLVDDDNPISFEDVIAQYRRDDASPAVPASLKLCAERAMVLLGDDPVELSVDDGHLFLYARTPYGEIDDVLKLDGHPDVSVKVDLALVHRALGACDTISIMNNGLVLTGPGGFYHVVATK